MARMARPVPHMAASAEGRRSGRPSLIADVAVPVFSRAGKPLTAKTKVRTYMSKTKTKPIKAILGFNKTAPTVLLARATAVLAGVYGDPTDYANPPIAMADFKLDVD